MATRRSFLEFSLAIVAAAFIAGCSSSDRRAISGEVTFAGEPVDGGSIVFLPGDDGGTKGAAEIIAGKYEIPPQQGLRPGKYRVEINWAKPTGKQIPSGDPGMTMEERLEVIPAKYNTASELTVEITAGENKHPFHLAR